jgi:predicted nucleic acid-binding protein
MADEVILVDSSWYIHKIRSHANPIAELLLAMPERDFVTCGVVQCEVGAGLRDENWQSAFRTHWLKMIHIPTDRALWDAAETLAFQMERRGERIPLTDVIIACCALRVGATLLTLDKHFTRISNLRCLAVLPSSG